MDEYELRDWQSLRINTTLNLKGKFRHFLIATNY